MEFARELPLELSSLHLEVELIQLSKSQFKRVSRDSEMQSFSFQEDVILFQYFEEETHNYLRTSTGNNPSFLVRKIYAKDRKRERLLLCFIVRQTIKFSCRKSTREEKKKYLDKREFRRDNSESEL